MQGNANLAREICQRRGKEAEGDDKQQANSVLMPGPEKGVHKGQYDDTSTTKKR
jgi:hypothetical protein